ncbi:MAG: F0F1 ATP synthase subunit A [Planctomycetota bacterium]
MTSLFSNIPIVLAAKDPVEKVIPHEIFVVWEKHKIDFDNQLIMGVVATVVVSLLLAGLAKRLSKPKDAIDDYIVTGPLWQLVETICEFVREQVARPNLGQLTDKYIPYLWTVFFFILTCNLLGMVPSGQVLGVIGSIFSEDTSKYLSHFGGTATGNLSLTVPLAFIAFIMINFVGLKEAGTDYLKHFCPIEVNSLGMVPLAILLVILEVMGLIIKSIVLAARLFGTMMAGHLVIGAFLGLVGIVTATAASFMVGLGVTLMGGALMMLELFIAMLQAFIFTFLTTLFIAQGAVHEHHDHEDEHDHEHGEEHADAHEPEPTPAAAPATA